MDDFYQDCALMSAIVTGQNNEPKTFQEVWYYDDQESERNGELSYGKNSVT